MNKQLAPSSTNIAWTKVYFIIIFACIFDQNNQQKSHEPSSVGPTSGPQDDRPLNANNRTLCLQNSVNNNLNDVLGILGELKKASNLMPNYVSNISYEAYSDSSRRNNNNNDVNKKTESTLTTVLAVGLLVFMVFCIGGGAGVIYKQNAGRRVIKAPVWKIPINDNNYSRFYI